MVELLALWRRQESCHRRSRKFQEVKPGDPALAISLFCLSPFNILSAPKLVGCTHYNYQMVAGFKIKLLWSRERGWPRARLICQL